MPNEGGKEAVGLLRKLVSIDSVFPKERRIAEFAAGALRKEGFAVKLQRFAPNRYNVVAQKGRRQGSVLLTAHLDTVPPYNYKSRNPLRLSERNGRLFGLGAYDMKSGLALILACAKACRPEKRGLRIVLTADEENISEGTWFAQGRGEFSGCSIAVCHEIADAIDGAREANGRPPILLGRRGRCVYKFDVTGIGAHAAGAGGVSALDLAMKLAMALEAIPMPSGKTGPCRLFVRKFESESRSLSMPTEAVIEADVHYIPPYTKESFLAYIKKSLAKEFSLPKGCGFRVEIPGRKTPYLPAYEADPDDPHAARFLSAYGRHIGKYALSYGLTVADENVLSQNGMPVITVGLAGGEAHSCREWVSKKDYLMLWDRMPKVVQEMLD